MCDKLIILNISEIIFPLFSNKLLNKTDLTVSSYVFILKWIKDKVNEYNDKYSNMDDLGTNIGDLFSLNLDDLVNHFLKINLTYQPVLSSINTSVEVYNFFNNKTKSAEYHILGSELKKINLLEWRTKFDHRKGDTFETAFPLHNSAETIDEDFKSVEYHRSLLQNDKELIPIWLINKGHLGFTFTLLDGFHRVVACYIEKKYDILANIIYV